jgi:hypothetical protein
VAEFVLVHGTTQSPAGWDRLAGALGARERLGVEPDEVGAGHCPHVSQPEAIAGILAQI